MTDPWKQNEEKSEDEELVVTEHRDDAVAPLDSEDETSIEMTQDTTRETLQEQGEDVASSPARRGHDNTVEGAGSDQDEE